MEISCHVTLGSIAITPQNGGQSIAFTLLSHVLDLELPKAQDIVRQHGAATLEPRADRLLLDDCFLATLALGSRSAYGRIATACSSVNLLLRMSAPPNRSTVSATGHGPNAQVHVRTMRLGLETELFY